MTCPTCSNQLQRRPSVHTISRSRYHLVLYELPMWMCHECGETLYTESQVDALTDLIYETERKVMALLEVSP